MIPALQQLQTGLRQVFAVPANHPETWFDTSGIELAKEQVVRDHGGASIAVDRRTIMASIEDFRRYEQVSSFRELKYVCLGVGSMVDRCWCILSDEKLRRRVLGLANSQEAHRNLRCFQALLSAYFSFPLSQADVNAEAGWKELRGWLQNQRLVLLDRLDNRPQWFDGLNRHSELLTDKPCDKIGSDLLRGDPSGLNDARSSLAIEADSWVMEAAVLAHMKAAAKLNDQSFKDSLLNLLQIATGQSGVMVGERLRIKCIALLVSRYAMSSAVPEHHDLRDASVGFIGNPWLHKTKWDADVLMEDGRPDNRAREMVFGWLKGRLIQDFFELLSAERSGDRRRLAYWLRFAPFVDDMWFALGSDAQSRKDINFMKFRDRARGRLLDLEGTTRDNNAFVMRIGSYLAIEFGSTGNAFFLLEWEKLPEAVSNALRSGRERELIGISSLKPTDNVFRERHTDAPTALKSWEQKFDDKLISKLGVMPRVRPACVPDLERLLGDRDIVVIDTRANGGSLKLTPDEKLAPIARQLQGLGMTHRSTRGWFKE